MIWLWPKCDSGKWVLCFPIAGGRPTVPGEGGSKSTRSMVEFIIRVWHEMGWMGWLTDGDSGRYSIRGRYIVDRSCTPREGEGGKRGKFFALKIEIQYNCSTFYIFYSRGNLESGSFTYMRDSVCKYIRNSGNFYCKKYRGISRNSAESRLFFQKIPYSVGSQKCTSVDTLHPSPKSHPFLSTNPMYLKPPTSKATYLLRHLFVAMYS